ncbi:alpha/beta fold hydrolase [Actinophytocola sp.]|uniref:alpha/beta fold hydrolase n=1 Tax=Actinophytocola sp. TaxID=1872138 RepID=UPI002D35649B|nr:alpha/beta fold hydrolase [Actinophytocola sp.]HYQ69640.1 alpha/beta fold hydrolase [Actinophytocola sp.]
MSTLVLVHGAWHGGWVWQRVASLLRAAGHEVHTPTMTGLCERAHLLSPSVGLTTHIQDVSAYLEAYDLWDVVLVGHGYAGQVVTAVADWLPHRVRARVYLDAFLGGDGEAAIDLLPDAVANHYRRLVEEAGFGWLVPARPPARLGVTEAADVAWLGPRLTPHPWLTYTEPLRLTGSPETPAVFVECTGWSRVFRPHAERAAARGWPVHELETGHEAMVTAPKELADLLLAR